MEESKEHWAKAFCGTHFQRFQCRDYLVVLVTNRNVHFVIGLLLLRLHSQHLLGCCMGVMQNRYVLCVDKSRLKGCQLPIN